MATPELGEPSLNLVAFLEITGSISMFYLATPIISVSYLNQIVLLELISSVSMLRKLLLN